MLFITKVWKIFYTSEDDLQKSVVPVAKTCRNINGFFYLRTVTFAFFYSRFLFLRETGCVFAWPAPAGLYFATPFYPSNVNIFYF